MSRFRNLFLAMAIALPLVVAAPGMAETPTGLDLHVFVDGEDATTGSGPTVTAGQPITFTYEIRNHTNETMWALYLYHEGHGRVTCPTTTIRPGQRLECERTTTATAGTYQADVEVTAWPERGSYGDEVEARYRTNTSPTTTTTSTTAPPTTTTTTAPTTTTTTAPSTGSGLELAVFVNGDDATIGSGPTVTAGARITFGYEITNHTNETMWALYLYHEGHGRVTCPTTTIRPGQRLECERTTTATNGYFADVEVMAWPERGSYGDETVARYRTTTTPPPTTTTTTAPTTTTTTAPTTTTTTPTTTTTTPPPPPVSGDLALRVLIDGDDASTGSGPTVTVGQPITFTYEIRNTTNETMWALYLHHEGHGRVTCPTTTIRPDQLVVCERTTTATAGTYQADVEATAWPELGRATATATARYSSGVVSGPNLANLALGGSASQSASGQWQLGGPASRAIDGNRDGDADNGSVAITYRVSDAWWQIDLGQVSDIDHIVIWNRTDCCSRRLRDFHVFVTDDPFEVMDIQGTESQHGVSDIEFDGEAGRKTVVPVNRTGRYVRIQLDYVDAVLQLAEVEIMGQQRSMTIEAGIAGQDADRSPGPSIPNGSSATLEFDVTNTGTTTLAGLRVNAPGFGVADCPRGSLDAGASATCTLDFTAQPGVFSSRARAVAYDPSGTEVGDFDPVHFFVPDSGGAEVSLEALLDGLNGDTPWGPRIEEGEVLNFTYLVSNTGSVRLTNVAVSDTMHGSIDCPSTTIEPGATLVCTHSKIARLIRAELDATVTASADRWTVSDTEKLYYHVKPYGREDELLLEVTINGRDADSAPGPTLEAGRTATIRYILTNNARVATMYSAEIIDPRVPAGSMSCSGGPNLGHYQSMVCTATIRIEPGQWSNIVIGHAYSTNGPRLDASDRVHYYGIL